MGNTYEKEIIETIRYENTEQLTMDKLKKTNINNLKIIYFLIGAISIIMIAVLILIVKNIMDNDMASLISSGLQITILIFIVFALTKYIKKEKKENLYIEEENFKIIEDKIYDKYYTSHTDDDGNTTYYYYVVCKIYGDISVKYNTYKYCLNNDSIYLVFYNGNENDNAFIPDEKQEYKRNSKNIDQEYLASLNSLSSELNRFLVPYNEILGESNFNERITCKIEKLEEKKGKVICKQCNKKYNLKKNDACPECGAIYHFDIKDVVHNKKWY